jgi:hypothetical protein|tara:strand:- start:193 stop:1782 length:1590 start_codon:yes stop_codon:yes gene_type:complete
MTDKELNDNIEKIKEFLQSDSYEAGFELLITLNDIELTKALNDEIIIALEKELTNKEMDDVLRLASSLNLLNVFLKYLAKISSVDSREIKLLYKRKDLDVDTRKIIDLKHSLAEKHALYLKDGDPVMSDTNLKEEEWITNSIISSEKFSRDIFESLYKDQNKKLVFELLQNPHFTEEYLTDLADSKDDYYPDKLYLLWLILKHPNSPETILKEASELDDSYENSLLKKAVALNKKTEPNIIQKLLLSSYRWVRQAAASHSSLKKKDILELIQTGDRYILKGLQENIKSDESVKETISNLLKDETKYPKQYTTYTHGLCDENHARIGAGEIPLETVASAVIVGSDCIVSALIEIYEEWGYYTSFFDDSGWFEGGGCLYITDSCIDLEEEEFEICHISLRDGASENFPFTGSEKYIDELEVGTFFFNVVSYDKVSVAGSLDEIVQEEELNIWECINHYSSDVFISNTFFGYPESFIIESDYDRQSTLYVKDSKNSFIEVSLYDLYDELNKEFGDKLSEENVAEFLKNKYKK